MESGITPKRIGVVGFDNVTASHLTAPADAFMSATLDTGYGGRVRCYEVCIIGLTGEPFRAESGITFTPQRTLETAPEFDTIIIPGGTGLRQPTVNSQVCDWIVSRAASTRRIAAICTGIYGLAPTALLDGREVTTHWRFAGDLSRRFPRLRIHHKRQLMRDGQFYTSTGLTAGIDLSLMLIEEDFGPQVALSVRQELVTYLAPAPAHTVSASAEQRASSEPTHRFAELAAWILGNLHEDLSVEALARRACICPRHFSRAFKSVFGVAPAAFVENLRLNEARRRLLIRRKTLDSVGASVGFTDAQAFRRAFERRFGKSPSRLLKPRDGAGMRVSTHHEAVAA
jgi:transcriptional regulator GlxA family with amidase domain